MEFIFYSILITLLYVYSGIGLTFLLCPKNLEKYSIFLSPFIGLSYLSYVIWVFINYSAFGTDVYAKWLLFPPTIFLIAAIIAKRDRIGEVLWPFRKENISLIIICILVFAAISTPYLLRVSGLNTITLGNNDIVNYATISKFITKSSLPQYDIGNERNIRVNIENFFFGAFVSTAFPSSIFSIEPYKLQNIVLYLFFVFSLPIVFLVGLEIFKYNKYMAMIIALLSGISFHLIHIIYYGFLGQVIGTGMFLSLFLFILYPILNCDKRSCFIPFIPLAIVLTFGLFISYSTLVPLFFIPLFMYILLSLIFTKSISHFLNSMGFLFLIVFVTFMMSPFSFIARIQTLFLFVNAQAGWDMPVLLPDWIFGLVGNNIWMHQIPIVYRIIVSIPVILIIIASFITLFKKERRIFYLSISYMLFIFSMYIYLIIKEISSPSFTGEGYKAYKLMTYFIPIIFLFGLSYFRDFHSESITKTQMLGMMFLILLIAGNTLSASAMIRTNYLLSYPIKENIIDLQKIAKMDSVSSINIVESSYTDQMWIYYFLFMDKKIYLKYPTYHAASPLLGEWTLQKVGGYDIITFSNIEQNIIEINHDYYLVDLPIDITLGKGWYELESNQNAKLRWTGENNETPTLELDVRKDGLSADFLLKYSPYDSNNRFSVFLDGKNIKDCEDKSFCSLNDIFISKGKHEMAFKSKLLPRSPGNGETRTLGYAFSDIHIIINNVKVEK
jgi:hypothetical protein